MNKEIIFHPYAVYKMEKRGITEVEVMQAINEPNSIVAGKSGRRIAQRIFGKHLLRVVFEEYQDHILVITAYPAKPERYLRR